MHQVPFQTKEAGIGQAIRAPAGFLVPSLVLIPESVEISAGEFFQRFAHDGEEPDEQLELASRTGSGIPQLFLCLLEPLTMEC